MYTAAQLQSIEQQRQQDFPLYYALRDSVESASLMIVDANKLINDIALVREAEKIHLAIGLLIKEHNFWRNYTVAPGVPFNGFCVDGVTSFPLNHIDQKLLRIIATFIN